MIFTAAKTRQESSIITPVSQVTLRLHSEDAGSGFSAIQGEVLKWLNKKAGRPLPKEAWEGESFELFRDVGYQPVAAAAIEKPRLWACRLDDADSSVPKRTWTTEVGIGQVEEGEVLLGCRLLCITMGDFVPFDPSIPAFVRSIIERFDARVDDRRVSKKAWRIEEPSEVKAFSGLLINPRRKRPVIVVSRGTREDPEAPALIDADRLASRAVGAAHVVLLGPRATERLTEEIGWDFRVHNRAIRTFNSRFSPDYDEPFVHPVASSRTIETWEGVGPEQFERFLVKELLRKSTAREFANDLPPYSKIHEFALERKREQARASGATESELLKLALDEIDSLKKKLIDDATTYDGLVEAAEHERDQANEALEQIESESSGLRARVSHLLRALEAKGTAEEIPIPESFDSLDDWCRTYLPGNIVVLPRALRAAKKADFQEPAIAYKALLLLRNEFVELRCSGGSDAIRAWHDGLASLGLEDRPTFSSTRAGEEGEEYKILWGRRKRLLDRHLKGNSCREDRYCFRLYYFWDEESHQVVVGSFPSHLSTRVS